ncbi:D-methionine transport system substrate-binding protein [Kytococcus aerolatus]|uniref:Lipoprotein n=1 Tax=Kytococcus aerolatus TaxID=592308 RepID=A0A212T519_9MICO|nr:MetQ/NlpA family ABC transporter substrate-binding protein [Kytococcus aerolatus]SNC61109.1 D-methionine transport system substrate-binding protein [Kytococcus aerolatus]
MITRRHALALGLGTLTLPALSACGGAGATSTTGPLRVGTTPVPHAEILTWIHDRGLDAEHGFELEVVEFTDYVQPNVALDEGSIDANYYQHRLFLAAQEEEAGYAFDIVAPVTNQPMGIYSESITDLADLPRRTRVAVPNDPANGARGLWLLEEQGIITLAEGVETPLPEDVIENPHELDIVPLEAAQLPRSLGDTALAAIPGNFAVQAELDPRTALVTEDPADERFAINVVTRPELVEDPRVTALVEVLGSREVGQFIQDTWKGVVVQL